MDPLMLLDFIQVLLLQGIELLHDLILFLALSLEGLPIPLFLKVLSLNLDHLKCLRVYFLIVLRVNNNGGITFLIELEPILELFDLLSEVVEISLTFLMQLLKFNVTEFNFQKLLSHHSQIFDVYSNFFSLILS